MPRKQKNIDRYFRDFLGDFRPLPDDAVWERISVRLAKKRKTPAIFMILRLAAGLALVTALGIVLHAVLKERQEDNQAYEQITSTDEAMRSVQPGNAITPVPYGKAPTATTPIAKALTETASAGHAPASTVIAENAADQAEMKGSEKEQQTPERQQAFTGPLTSTDLQVTASTRMAADRQQEVTYPPLTWLEGLEAGILPVRDDSDLNSDQSADKQINQVLQPGLEAMTDRSDMVPVRTQRSWILSGELAPVYSYRRIASENLDDRQLSALNDAENGILAYAGGIHISYAPSRRFSIQSGISYSRYGQEKEIISHYRSANADVDQIEQNLSSLDAVSITNSTGHITPSPASKASEESFLGISSNIYTRDNLENVSAVQFFDFLEFPIIFRYKLIDRKTDVKLVGGMLTSLLVGNQVFLKGDEDSKYYGKTVSLRSVNVLGTVGLGVEYPFTGGFTVNIEPRFGYYLNSIDMASDISVHPYSFGIFTGVSYNF